MKKVAFKALVFFLTAGALWSQKISLTVYNRNRALVREERALVLDRGTSTISFTDVAARIDPTSVHFKSLTAPEKLTILEQNYEYDLISAQKIMHKYLDEDIRLVMEKGDVYRGKLLNVSGQEIVIQDEEGGVKIIRNEGVQHFDFLELPEGLITRPTLVWMVENNGPEKHQTEVSYLTGGVNWHAEYVAVVAQDDKHMDFSGWVSVENHSGTMYKDASLKLVAGDVHMIESRARTDGGRLVKELRVAEAASQFEEKAFFEYHLYSLQRRTTLKDNQTKQISLFPPSKARTDKLFLYDGSRFENKVRVHLEFKNSRREGLGLPLPKGKIRVYKEDVDGALEFIGEDLIDHTPENEKVKIFLGNAFDLVGERIQKSSKKISTRSREDMFQILLRNHKEDEVEIVVVEHFSGDWEILQRSHDFEKKDATTAEFRVQVPTKEEVIINYTVLLRY